MGNEGKGMWICVGGMGGRELLEGGKRGGGDVMGFKEV